MNSPKRIPFALRVCGICLYALCGMIVSELSDAKMTIITLAELVSKSEVIVYGHVKSPATGPSAQSNPHIFFEVVSILKGKTIITHGMILLCGQDENSDLPDLSKLSSELIIFAVKRPNCFDLAHGDRSIVPTAGGRANTVAIDDQPNYQPLKKFLKKVRALVAKETGSLN